MFAIVLADGTPLELVVSEDSFFLDEGRWWWNVGGKPPNGNRTDWEETSAEFSPDWNDLLPFEIDVKNGKRVPDGPMKPSEPQETNPSAYLEL